MSGNNGSWAHPWAPATDRSSSSRPLSSASSSKPIKTPSPSPGPPIPTRETGVKWFQRGPMRPGFFVLAIGFASLLGAGVAAAGTLVQFPNLPGQTPAKLVGYLVRPDTGLSLILGGGSADSARHPAVVVLHGCSGFSSHSAAIADRLGSWGYVALTVDSLGPRGIASACGHGLPPRHSTPTRHCTTWRGWRRSIPRGSPCLASRWAGPRC